jgi:hypothetical protein
MTTLRLVEWLLTCLTAAAAEYNPLRVPAPGEARTIDLAV